MLYVVIEAERARLKKLYKENEPITLKSRLIPEDKGGSQTEQYVVNVLGQHFTKEPVSSHAQSLVQDSEWFMLSPQEKYAFKFMRGLYLALYIGGFPVHRFNCGWKILRENRIMESSQKLNLNLSLSGNCYIVFTLYLQLFTL